MGLKIKRFEEIFKNMVNWTTSKSSRLTDFSVGSAVRSLLESVTYELEQFYFSMYTNVMHAIENSSFEAFGFTKRPAVAAFGEVVVTFAYPTRENFLIQTGTRFAATVGDRLVYFRTTKPYDVRTGSLEAKVEVVCEEAGTIGNVARDSIRIMVNPIRDIETITNPTPFLTGEDEESQQSRKARFSTYVSNLSKGTRSAVEYGVLEVEGVAGCYVDDSLVGVVNIYAHDRNGNLSDDLKKAIEKNLINYRSAGIQTIVQPIERIDLIFGAFIDVDEKYHDNNYLADLRNSVESYLNSFRVGETLHLSALIQYIRNYDRALIKDIEITHPRKDLELKRNQLIRAKEVVIEYEPPFERQPLELGDDNDG